MIFPPPEAFSLLLLLCAPAVGAFLGVLADRLPRGEDVVRLPSRCRSCGTRLRWRDMVPVVSFVARRGRCATCGAELPGWLLWIELGATLAALLALLASATAGQAWTQAAFLWLLLALGLADALWFRLPDPLTLALAVLVLGGAAFGGAGAGADALVGAALGVACFAAIRWGYAALRDREGLGMGDVKLMAGLGAFAGPLDLPVLVLGGALAALAGAGIAALAGAGGAALRADRALPFGTALCVSAAALWFARAAGWWPPA